MTVNKVLLPNNKLSSLHSHLCECVSDDVTKCVCLYLCAVLSLLKIGGLENLYDTYCLGLTRSFRYII